MKKEKKERLIKVPESKYRQLMRSRQLLIKAKAYGRPLFQLLSQIKEVEEVK